MSFSSTPLALIGATMAAGICLFLAFQAAAWLLPFLMSSPYRTILAIFAILLLGLGGAWRDRKRRKASLPAHS